MFSKLSKLNPNKSCGLDLCRPRILYETKNGLCKPLYLIFSKSFEEGTVPSVWKNASIRALYKKGDRQLPANYRLVSLTSVCCMQAIRICY